MGPTRTGGRSVLLMVSLALGLSLGACAKPKPAAKPSMGSPAAGIPRTDEPVSGDPSVADTHISYCRSYADQMAGRELQREYDSMKGRFRGSESQVFRDFAKMDAQKNYRRIYENCIRDRTAARKNDGAASN